MSEQAERPWSAIVRVDDIPESGRHVELVASAEIRAALAKPTGVDAVENLVASFDLTRRGRDGLRVSGVVRASVLQSCVVSLDPVRNEIEEDVDADFAPSREAPAKPGIEDIEVTAGSGDEPEPLINGAVDLGLLATEFLIFGVDPFPRKPGVAFEAPKAADEGAHPFAGLAALKKTPDGGG